MSDDVTVHDQSLQSRVRRPDKLRDDVVVDDATVFFMQLSKFAGELPRWSYWPSQRDRSLRRFFKTEPLFAGTVYSMAARLKALNMKVTGDKKEMVKDTLRLADFHKGWPYLVSKTVQDLATQDNGAFWELIGAGNPAGPLIGPVKAVEYIDSAQCFRTYNTEYPVIYINPITRDVHKLHHTRVVSFSNMPQPDELARDIGFSVLSRALANVQTAQAMQRFRHEKVTGKFTRGIIHGSGVTSRTLEAALATKKASDEAIGLTYYGQIPVLISPQGVQLDLLDLASLPDNFVFKDEITIYVYAIALAWGVDAREFWPATVAGASKADASVQHMKAMGKGIADYIQMIEGALNERVCPPGTKVEFDYVDDEHDRARTEMQRVRVQTLSNLKKDGVLNMKHYMAHLLEEKILRSEVIKEADGIITDADEELLKMLEEQEEAAEELRQGLVNQRPNQTERAEGPGARNENDQAAAEGRLNSQDGGNPTQLKTLDRDFFLGGEEPEFIRNGLAARSERALGW